MAKGGTWVLKAMDGQPISRVRPIVQALRNHLTADDFGEAMITVSRELREDKVFVRRLAVAALARARQIESLTPDTEDSSHESPFGPAEALGVHTTDLQALVRVARQTWIAALDRAADNERPPRGQYPMILRYLAERTRREEQADLRSDELPTADPVTRMRIVAEVQAWEAMHMPTKQQPRAAYNNTGIDYEDLWRFLQEQRQQTGDSWLPDGDSEKKRRAALQTAWRRARVKIMNDPVLSSLGAAYYGSCALLSMADVPTRIDNG